ncbi:hypothetical protein AB0J21_19180 [Streptomyces sp. NPDC049954]|uniref:hypothetical protein n=1 Tax=Streptomyces sp. NPDC049954 TaxID=3155779 RepID=UPI003444E9C4
MAAGAPRWNATAQRWETDEAPLPYQPPPPPRPGTAPLVAPPPLAEWSEPEPPQAPGPYRRPAGRTVAVAVAAALVVGGGVAAWLTWGTDDGDRTPAAAQRGKAATSPRYYASPETDEASDPELSGAEDDVPGEESSPSGESPGLPDGFATHEDPAGFTVAAPEDWKRSEKDTGVFYTAPDERSLLQIFVVTEDDLTPEKAVTQSSRDLRSRTEGYREIALGPVDGGPENPAGDAAELTYAYESEKTGGTREVIERAFTAVDGKQYAVLAAGPKTDTDEQRDILDTALAHFVPDGY